MIDITCLHTHPYQPTPWVFSENDGIDKGAEL